MTYYFDTSAVVKIYYQEVGTIIVLPIYKSEDKIYIS